jgi:multiple antibiotic resistance protein
LAVQPGESIFTRLSDNEVARLDIYAFSLFALSSLFAVIDPLGCIPFFSGLTANMDDRHKRKVLLKALLVALLVLLLFTWGGRYLLELFGITIAAFRIAGGVILFGIGLDMLQSKPRRWRTGIQSAFDQDQEMTTDQHDDDPSVTPLAIPMLAGPGSITTVMVLVPEVPQGWGATIVSLAVLVILIATGGILMGADLVLQRIGQTGMRIVEKLMGLLVTVIAVQLVLNGATVVVKDMLAS